MEKVYKNAIVRRTENYTPSAGSSEPAMLILQDKKRAAALRTIKFVVATAPFLVLLEKREEKREEKWEKREEWEKGSVAEKTTTERAAPYLGSRHGWIIT